MQEDWAERKRSLFALIKRGISLHKARLEAGVHWNVLQRWLENGPEFYREWAQVNSETPMTLGIRKTAEQERAERLETAREVGDCYREISFNYPDWCRKGPYPLVRPRSLPPE
jgi:hypothetical protein